MYFDTTFHHCTYSVLQWCIHRKQQQKYKVKINSESMEITVTVQMYNVSKKLMGLNTWCQAGGAVLEGCRTIRRKCLAEGNG